MNYPELASRFAEYVGGYRSPDGSLSDAFLCKYQHTFDVVRFAGEISAREAFPVGDQLLGRVCALFHDIARFEQLKRFHTFSDKLSGFDHGYEATRILLERNFLADLTPAERICVLAAVEFHNKLAIPEGICGEYALKFAKLTRDADKLAILDLVCRYLKGEIKVEDDTLIALSRSEGTEVSQEILEAVLAGRACSYGMIRNQNDFLTCLFAWPQDLNYAASASLALSGNLYGTLRTFLPEDPVFTRILNLTKKCLKCRCSKSKI